MPTIRNRTQQPSPVAPQVELPSNFPAIPREIVERFPEAEQWQRQIDEFWDRANAALQESQQQSASFANSRVIFSVDQFLIYAKNGIPQPMFALDSTGVKLGNVLTVSTPGRKVFIGVGEFQNDNTPFYVDALGRFSLGSSLSWDPETDTLTVVGVINATSGTIGGFEIGSDYIRDTANTFGLASTVTGGDDVRFWAGETFANRASAPLRFTESGVGVIGGFTIGATTLSAGSGDSAIFLDAFNGLMNLGTASVTNKQLAMVSGEVALALATWPMVRMHTVESGGSSHGLMDVFEISDPIPAVRLDGGNRSIVFYADTNLYRSAANTLKTDDAFIAAGAVQFSSLAGVGTRNVVADALGNLTAP